MILIFPAGKPVSVMVMSVIFATSSAVRSPLLVDTTTLTLSSPMKATQSV